jgi:acetylglutamate kinase
MSAELGRVGRVQSVNIELIEAIWAMGSVPVVAPLAGDGQGSFLNVNGDMAAGALAVASAADYLIFYTDSGGVRRTVENPATRVNRLSREEALAWIEDGTASSGMIPKLQSAVSALDGGVGRVVIGAYRPESGTEVVRRGGESG